MATESDLDLFARVVNGAITEFPVYRLHIKNRSHPIDWYTPVVEKEKPELPSFSYYKRTLSLMDTYVEAAYEVVPMSLAELLPTFKKASTFPGEDDRMLITEVDPMAIQQVYILGGQYVTSKLNDFARTRLYDDIKSLCDYRDSSFEKFKTEGARGYYLRDRCWESILAYFQQVTTGMLPVPISISEVDAIIPPLTWEDPEAPVVEPEVEPDAAPVAEEPVVEDTPVVPEENTEEAAVIGDPVDPGTETVPDPVETTEPSTEPPVVDPLAPETPVEETPVEETPTEDPPVVEPETPTEPETPVIP